MNTSHKIKLTVALAVISLFNPAFSYTNKLPNGGHAKENTLLFTENKGQISDQYNKPRPDVLFSGSSGDLAYYLRKNGISYQFCKVEKWRDENSSQFSLNKGMMLHIPVKTSIYRLDINWIGIHQNAGIQTDRAIEGYNNYYLEVCPNGATNVKTYTGLSYINIYNGIDLHYYEKNGELKYDYLVAAGAEYKQIQMKVEGSDKIQLMKDGSLTIFTPFGNVSEGEPLVYQNGKRLSAKWVIHHNILSFEIKNYNPGFPLVIDPVVRVWGTYYGDAATETGWSSCADLTGNVYMTGLCQASGTAIATTGGHQTTYGGWYNDAFLVKFNASGVRQWGTYYGGTGNDFGNSCALDLAGNVYLAGNTDSNNGTAIATPGSHQPACGGGLDAFLVQFNSITGQRQWATYYGGIGDESGVCCTDALGNVFLGGSTGSQYFGISTFGSHQVYYGGGIRDGFLAKFNSSGIRQWGTYYGGSGDDMGCSCATDANGNIVMVGNTASAIGTVIASPGSHQPTHNGNFDGFIVKLDSNGVRQWGTYYGGTTRDNLNCCAIDAAGNIFVAGDTQSSSGTDIATLGSFQPIFGGGNGPFSDAYLAKFNSSGIRQWGTYYGSQQDDKGYGLAVNSYGNVYMAGQTTSNTQISTNGTPQVLNGGNNDAFLARFSTAGARDWGTFYGGYGLDVGYSCCVDASNSIYMVGCTQTSSMAGTVIATQGSHQSTDGGNWDAFAVKFYDCDAAPAPTNTTPFSSLTVCSNMPASLMVSSTDSVQWFATQTSTTVLGAGNSFMISGLPPGTYSYYACATSSCFASGPRTAVSLTVLPNPVVAISGPAVICSGQNATLTATGANSYTWNNGVNTSGNIVTATASTSYKVLGTSSFNNCRDSATFNLGVNAVPVIVITGPATVCTGQNAILVASGANTYTWNSGRNTATNVISPTSHATYTVTGTLAGCTGFGIFNITLSHCTSISELDEDSAVKLFPNPITRVLNLVLPSSLDGGADLKWQIINSLGQIVIRSGTSANQASTSIHEGLKIEIDTGLLPAGVYYLQVEGSVTNKAYKIVKRE